MEFCSSGGRAGALGSGVGGGAASWGRVVSRGGDPESHRETKIQERPKQSRVSGHRASKCDAFTHESVNETAVTWMGTQTGVLFRRFASVRTSFLVFLESGTQNPFTPYLYGHTFFSDTFFPFWMQTVF